MVWGWSIMVVSEEKRSSRVKHWNVEGTSAVVKVRPPAVPFAAQLSKTDDEKETVRLELSRVSVRSFGGRKYALTSVPEPEEPKRP